jgi:uncharacterized membrane protein YeaQ/YmgE (transglycosylase-associated protein family)
MEWSFTNLWIEIVTGALGGNAAAMALKEHSFGVLGHTAVGAIGGALSGFFLQTFVTTVVNASGDLNQPTMAEQVILQCFVGAAAGGIAMMIVGLIKHGLDQKQSTKS